MRLVHFARQWHTRLAGALITLFLCAQFAVTQHQSHIEKNHTQHHCEVCLLDVELHGANTSAKVTSGSSPANTWLDNAPRVVSVTAFSSPYYPARGPPV